MKAQRAPPPGTSSGGPAADDGPALKDDEEYKKYARMLKMGMAKEQVSHALQRDGKDPAIAEMDFDKSLKSQTGASDAAKDDGPLLKDDPVGSVLWGLLLNH